MKASRRLAAIAAVFFGLSSVPLTMAQYNPMAPSGAMDTLSDSSVGGAGSGAVNRAARVAGQPRGNQPKAGAPAGAAPYMNISPEAMARFQQQSGGGTMPPGMPIPGMTPGGVQTPTATPTPKRFPAIKGQRVFDAVSYKRNGSNAIILDDVYRLEISEDELDQYSNDGTTLGDLDATDPIYSQILPASTNDYIGGQTNFYLQRVVAMLQNAESLDPLQFFGLQALTTEEFSQIPKYRAKVQEQMSKVASVGTDGAPSGWAYTFLRDFRVDAKDPDSKFYPLYIPRYPEPPSSPPPAMPWKPFTRSMITDMPEQATGRPGQVPGFGPGAPGARPVSRPSSRPLSGGGGMPGMPR